MPYEELLSLIRYVSHYETLIQKSVTGSTNNSRQIVTLHTLVHIDIILCIILISYLDHIVYILSQELQFGCVWVQSGSINRIWLCSY